jgi:hypothetical protein
MLGLLHPEAEEVQQPPYLMPSCLMTSLTVVTGTTSVLLPLSIQDV